MECAKWSEEGLLYTSGELDREAITKYQKHLESCEYCRSELNQYNKDKTALFSVSILQEPTSQQLDEKVMAACMKIPRPTAGPHILLPLIKKSAFAAVFLLCGFAGGVYIALNIERLHGDDMKMARQNNMPSLEVRKKAVDPADVMETEMVSGAQTDVSISRDTGKSDSARLSPSYDAKRRGGDMKEQGVVPVDLQNR